MSRSKPLRLWLLAATLHAVILWLVLDGTLAFLFNDATHRLGRGTDFQAYVNAARGFAEGKSVYGQGPGFGYRYHPGFAMAIAPIVTRVSDAAAYWGWFVLNELLLVSSLVLVAPRVARVSIAVAVVAFLFAPTWLELYMGNASLVSACLLLIGLELDRRGHTFAFAALLTISIFVKPMGILLLPILLAQGRWRLVAIVVTITGGSLLAYLFSDRFSRWYFTTVNFRVIPSAGWAIHAGHQGLHGLLLRLLADAGHVSTATLKRYTDLPAASAFVLRALPFVVATVCAYVTLRLRAPLRRREPEALALAVMLWSAAYVLGYKDVWEHSYAFFVLPLVLLWISPGAMPRRFLVVFTAVMALPSAFVLYDVKLPPGPNDPEHHWGTAVAAFHHAWRPAWVVAMLVVVARIALARRPAAGSAENQRSLT